MVFSQGPIHEAEKMMPGFYETGVYQSFLTYGPPLLAIIQRPSRLPSGLRHQRCLFAPKVFATQIFPNYSYGIAEDFHPTSFEINN